MNVKLLEIIIKIKQEIYSNAYPMHVSVLIQQIRYNKFFFPKSVLPVCW